MERTSRIPSFTFTIINCEPIFSIRKMRRSIFCSALPVRFENLFKEASESFRKLQKASEKLQKASEKLQKASEKLHKALESFRTLQEASEKLQKASGEAPDC